MHIRYLRLVSEQGIHVARATDKDQNHLSEDVAHSGMISLSSMITSERYHKVQEKIVLFLIIFLAISSEHQEKSELNFSYASKSSKLSLVYNKFVANLYYPAARLPFSYVGLKNISSF